MKEASPETLARLLVLMETCAIIKGVASKVAGQGLYMESERLLICAEVIYATIEEFNSSLSPEKALKSS
jgi:hypothetical protein